LAAFQAALDELRSEDIRVIGASTDARDKASETAQKLELDFPLAFGLDAEAVSATLGAFYETRRSILHATAFVVRPESTVAVASYSTGPIGRMVPDNVLRAVRFYKKNA